MAHSPTIYESEEEEVELEGFLAKEEQTVTRETSHTDDYGYLGQQVGKTFKRDMIPMLNSNSWSFLMYPENFQILYIFKKKPF